MIAANRFVFGVLPVAFVLWSFPLAAAAQGTCGQGETATECATNNGWSNVRDWENAHRLKYWNGVISSDWWVDPDGVCATVKSRTLTVLGVRHLGWGGHSSNAGEWYPTHNKVLTLAGRDEVRDFVDIMQAHEDILPLGAMA